MVHQLCKSVFYIGHKIIENSCRMRRINGQIRIVINTCEKKPTQTHIEIVHFRFEYQQGTFIAKNFDSKSSSFRNKLWVLEEA